MDPNSSSFRKFLDKHQIRITRTTEFLLLVSFYVSNYHFSVLYTLLTDVWKLNLYNSVIITNIQDGSKSVFPILVACLADTYLGDSFMLLLSALLYFMGLLIWYLVIPTGEENNRGFITLEAFFYLSLVLITVGQSGYVKYNGAGNEERHVQGRAVSDQDERQEANETEDTTRSRLWIYTRKIFTRLWSEIIDYKILIVGMPIAIFLIPGGRPEYLWLAVGLISTSAVFFIGNLYYRSFRKPQTSSLVQVFRVFLAAFNKRHYDTSETSRYYGDADSTPQPQLNNSDDDIDNHVDHDIENNNSELELVAHTSKLGFLDKATLYNPSTENAGTEFDNHRLFTVNQVNDTKRFFKAIRLSSIFLMYGILTSVGDTFFTGQANEMDAYIFSFEVPIEVINYSPRVTQELVSRFSQWVRKKHVKGPHYPFYGAGRVCLAMLLSVPCFVAAYLVEAKRLKALKTDSDMSVFWLMPQLFLLGVMDGLAKTGIEDFFAQEMPEPVSSSYGNFFAEGVVGVGQLLGCLWFVCWYSLSKLGGSSGWFGDDIDHSHLDRYYVVMAVLGFASCIICTFVSVRRYLHKSRGSGESLETPAPHCDSVVQSTQCNLTDRPLQASISFRVKESNPQPVI